MPGSNLGTTVLTLPGGTITTTSGDKEYFQLETSQIQAACGLTDAQWDTNLPDIFTQMLDEGQTTVRVRALLEDTFRPDDLFSLTYSPSHLSGTPSATSSTSKWVHINQARPDEPLWRLWRRACSQWSLHGQLYFPLGSWTRPGGTLRQEWPFYYDHSNGKLYVRQEDQYLRCFPIDDLHLFFHVHDALDTNRSEHSGPCPFF
jgi:hypothetical protein